ncbi:MAG: glycosyltransferase family 4 protein [Flavobacteriales bacterium]|nr:glycosyltransferase family 4 protein [Flavobacteriales bacterium]
MTARPRKSVLFLYTEIAPYFVACLEELVRTHPVEVHLVRWPVNEEAPFHMQMPQHVQVVERRAHNDKELERICLGFDPTVAFASGWVDKGYLRTCRALHRAGVPTVMCSDTAWRGRARQWMGLFAAQPWLRSTFSHAWVTGAPQARYAHLLGFHKKRIRTGFYSADVSRFAPISDLLGTEKRARFPHRLLCVARYIPTKGHQLLCDAFAKACDEGRAQDWELWIAGTGELHEQVVSSSSGQHPRITHLGFVQASEMPAVMAQCGVFVLPSTYEPWGVVVHEHAAAGFPLLLSDAVGAHERFLRAGKNGTLFKAGDPADLYRALTWMMDRSDVELLRMGGVSARLGMDWDPAAWARVVMELIEER